MVGDEWEVGWGWLGWVARVGGGVVMGGEGWDVVVGVRAAPDNCIGTGRG